MDAFDVIALLLEVVREIQRVLEAEISDVVLLNRLMERIAKIQMDAVLKVKKAVE